MCVTDWSWCACDAWKHQMKIQCGWSLLLALTGIAFVDMLYVLVTSSTTCTRLVWSYLTITCSLLGWQSASPSNHIIVLCCVLHGPHFMGTNVVATPSFEHGGRDLNRSLFVCRSGFHLASKLIVSFFNFLTHLLYWKSFFFLKKKILLWHFKLQSWECVILLLLLMPLPVVSVLPSHWTLFRQPGVS